MVGEKFYRAGWEVEDHEGKFEGGVGEMQFFRGRVAEVAEKCRGRGGVRFEQEIRRGRRTGLGENMEFEQKAAKCAKPRLSGRGWMRFNRRLGGEGGRGWMEIWNLNIRP